MRIIRFCSQRCLVAAGSAAAALIPVTRPAAAQSAPSGAASTAAASVSPAPGSGAGQPPPYTPVRYNEDYRYLQDPALRTDPFDPIKYIPLTDAGDTYLSLGGSARERYEYFHNENFGAGTEDPTGYYLTRLFANADLHVGDALRGFVQLKSSMIDGRAGGPRPQDADEFDVQQAFVDLRVPLGTWGGGPKDAATFRFGRQDLLYGAQRLIGPLDWTNVRRTFEGGKAVVVTGNNQLDLFWVRPVVVEKEELNNGDGNTSFAGIYDTLALPDVLGAAAGSKLELYGLALNKTKTPAFETAPAVSADSDTYTIGTRFSAAPRPFDLDVEADYQFGQFKAGDLNAWSIAAEGGYTLAGAPFTPRLFLGFDYASGDNDGADRDRQTFNQLFPTGHLYFGYIDAIGRQNIIDVHPGVEVALLKNRAYAKSVTLRAEYHQFWRASTNDAVYNAAGGITRAAVAGNHERSVGGELDLLLNWQIDRHLSSYVGYSHFFTGAYIQDTGPGKDIDFFYAAMQFTF